MTELAALLRSYSLSFWRSERWKSLVTVVGMSLGLALFSGIQFANEAAVSSFEDSAAILRGGADFEITAASGELSESRIVSLRNLPGVASAEPASKKVVEMRAGNVSLGPVEVLGVNAIQRGTLLGERPAPENTKPGSAPGRKELVALLREPDAAWITDELAIAANGAPLQIVTAGKTVPLRAVATLPRQRLTAGRRAILDISTFQEIFETSGRVDSILVTASKDVARETLERAIIRDAGPTALVHPANQSAGHAKKMTEAFRLNLQFLSSISLFVSFLLVYNTMSFFVLKRRKDLGTLQALGVTPRRIRSLLIAEAAILGIVGSVLGLAGGYLFGAGSLRFINATLQNIYGQSAAQLPPLSPLLVLETLALGPLLALCGSLGPSSEVYSVPLRETFSYQTLEERFSEGHRLRALVGVLLLLLAGLAATPSLLALDTRLGFLSPSFTVFGFCFVIPLILRTGLEGLCRAREALPLSVVLAADHVRRTPRRNSVAVSAVAVALGMSFSLTVMIASFRDTVGNWIHFVTKADIFVSGQFGPTTSLGTSISGTVLDALRRFPGVKDYDPIATRTADFGGRLVRLTGARMDVIRDRNRLLFKRPMSASELAEVTAKPETIFVSEVFSRRTGKKEGDWVDIPGTNGMHRGHIANVFYDYSSDQGVIMLPFEALEALHGPVSITGITLYLEKPDERVEVVRQLKERFHKEQLNIRDNLSLRAEVLRIFDDTFRITYALQFIALLVSAGALMNTLSMLALERLREFAVLRALGGAGRELVRMITAEALIIGAGGVFFGSILGFILSLILVFVVNTHFFGWSIVFHLPLLELTAGAGVALALAAAAGKFHGHRMLERLNAEILRSE